MSNNHIPSSNPVFSGSTGDVIRGALHLALRDAKSWLKVSTDIQVDAQGRESTGEEAAELAEVVAYWTEEIAKISQAIEDFRKFEYTV